MPAPNHRTLPTPCDRGCGPMRRCGQCRGHVHGGVVQVRAGSRTMVRWERTAQKSVRWETKGVRTLNQGAIAPRLRTDRQSPEAP